MVSNLENDRNEKMDEHNYRKSETDTDTEEHSLDKLAKEKEVMRMSLITCKSIIDQVTIKGCSYFLSLKVDELKEIVRYHFKSDEYKKRGVLKPELRIIVTRLYEEATRGT